MNNSIFNNKNILVLGGTGTIGSAIVRELLDHHPKVIRVFSRDENKQFQMQQEVGSFHNVRFLLGDIRDLDRLKRAMEGIDIVFHTAALKHVVACEYNSFEAVKTNIVGTQNVIDCAIEKGVKIVLFTSSDKAVNPNNAMGTSKLMAERLMIAANQHRGPRSTIFYNVRLGNVTGSRGSVIPLFLDQIRKGGPLTLTSSAMTRYVMTLKETVEFLFDTISIAKGGEIFIKKIPALNISDMAEVLMELVGKKVPVETIGIKMGEKSYEELVGAEERSRTLETEQMYVIYPSEEILQESLRSQYLIGKLLSEKQWLECSSHRATLLNRGEIKNFLENNHLHSHPAS